MSNSTICPVCEGEEGWSVLVTTQVGVRLPGDSQAAADERTLREVRACEECGVCYDPIIAAGTGTRTGTGTGAVDAGARSPDPEAGAGDDAGTADDDTGTGTGPPPEAVIAEVEDLRREVRRLSNAVAAVGEVQAGMADAIPGIDREDVAEALARREVADVE